MAGFNTNQKDWTAVDVRAAAIDAASRIFQGEGIDLKDFAVDISVDDQKSTVERKLFDLTEKIYKYIDTGEKPR